MVPSELPPLGFPGKLKYQFCSVHGMQTSKVFFPVIFLLGIGRYYLHFYPVLQAAASDEEAWIWSQITRGSNLGSDTYSIY